jgi:5'-3' exonuclease
MDDKVSRLGLGMSNAISNGEGEGEEHGMFFLDGNVIMIFGAYFEIMVRVAHGGVKDTRSKGDWVLIVFKAFSMILHLLEVRPTHVATIFDYQGLTFRH